MIDKFSQGDFYLPSYRTIININVLSGKYLIKTKHICASLIYIKYSMNVLHTEYENSFYTKTVKAMALIY